MQYQLNQMMKQAQKMQKQMAALQEELAKKEYEGKAGGDMVVVKVNGKQEVLSVRIQKEVVDPTDIGMLEDLVRAAVNDALGAAQKDSETSMKSVTGGLGLPGF